MLELGFIEVGQHRIYAIYALQQPPAGVGDKVRARAGGAHLVLLFPALPSNSWELPSITLESALPSRRGLIRQAVYACGLDGSVSAIHTAPDGARLVVDTQICKVWIDGVEIGGLPPDSHAFQFVELLARHSHVSADDVVAKISPGRQDGTTAARQAKRHAKQVIAQAMTAAGSVFDEDPFPSAGNGSYRCVLPAYVR